MKMITANWLWEWIFAQAIADYSDSAKLALISIADQFDIATFYMVDTAKGGEKKVQLTVLELKEAIAIAISLMLLRLRFFLLSKFRS